MHQRTNLETSERGRAQHSRNRSDKEENEAGAVRSAGSHTSDENSLKGSTDGRKRSVFDSLRAFTRRISKHDDTPGHARGDSLNWSVVSKNERSANSNNERSKTSRNASIGAVGEESKMRYEDNVLSPSVSRRCSLTEIAEAGFRPSPPPPPPVCEDLITELSLPPSSTTSQYQVSSPIFLHIDSTLLAIARLRYASFQVGAEIKRIQVAQANLLKVKAHNERRRKENLVLMETRQPEEWRKQLEEEEKQLLRWSESLDAEDNKLTRTLQDIYADRTERDRILDQTAAGLAQDKAEVALVSEQLRLSQRELDARTEECERLERMLNGE